MATPSPEFGFSAAAALWRQRHRLAEARPRLDALRAAIDDPVNLSPFQYAQLYAATLEFAPDLILELGRHRGNSTAVFLAAANQLAMPPGSLVSLDLSSNWEQLTLPRLRPVVPEDWFAPLAALRRDILRYDFATLLGQARRPLLFWDAHGLEVAECVLGSILPRIAAMPHLAIMHDVSDTRYADPASLAYGGDRLWKRTDHTGPRLKLGHLDSEVGQVIAILDFATRNRLPLHSADHSLRTELSAGSQEELASLLGEYFSTEAHWLYFSLNQVPPPHTFPRYEPPEQALNHTGRRIGTALGRLLRGR
ncbi:MAG: hypothetical protein JST11_15240 [Acidobacteria bacterium]|nr:hypothetical protein [Acidobacteriota bacterium]